VGGPRLRGAERPGGGEARPTLIVAVAVAVVVAVLPAEEEGGGMEASNSASREDKISSDVVVEFVPKISRINEPPRLAKISSASVAMSIQ